MKRTKAEIKLLSLLRFKVLCFLVFRTRLFYFLRIRRSFRVYDDQQAVLGNEYSTERLLRGWPHKRILLLIRPLVAIEGVNRDSSVLSIGCRFEADLLYLCGHGFDPRKVLNPTPQALPGTRRILQQDGRRILEPVQRAVECTRHAP